MRSAHGLRGAQASRRFLQQAARRPSSAELALEGEAEVTFALGAELAAAAVGHEERVDGDAVDGPDGRVVDLDPALRERFGDLVQQARSVLGPDLDDRVPRRRDVVEVEPPGDRLRSAVRAHAGECRATRRRALRSQSTSRGCGYAEHVHDRAVRPRRDPRFEDRDVALRERARDRGERARTIHRDDVDGPLAAFEVGLGMDAHLALRRRRLEHPPVPRDDVRRMDEQVAARRRVEQAPDDRVGDARRAN